jgi:hypothetical protein
MEPVILLLLGHGLLPTEAEQRQVADMPTLMRARSLLQ